MGSEYHAHNIGELEVQPIKRTEHELGLGYSYTRTIKALDSDGNRHDFIFYFSDAVAKRMEGERLKAEYDEAQDQARAMELMDELERKGARRG